MFVWFHCIIVQTIIPNFTLIMKLILCGKRKVALILLRNQMTTGALIQDANAF